MSNFQNCCCWSILRILFLPLLLLSYTSNSNIHAFSNPINRVEGSQGKRTASCSAMLKQPHDSTTITTDPTTTHLIFPGGGIYFYWYAGVIEYLKQEQYDMSQYCTYSGASAGALAATLTALDVNFYSATELALNMASDAGVWDRQSGLQGIWGPMIEDWLDVLLPTSIQPVQGRLSLLVTPVPSFGKTKVCHFIDRQDLIRANLASVHLPWFLDGKLTTNFRNQPHIDGSFLSKPQDYFPHKKEDGNREQPCMIVLDWKNDPSMRGKGGLDIVEALSHDGIWGLLEQGKSYAKIMEQEGQFESLPKKEILK